MDAGEQITAAGFDLRPRGRRWHLAFSHRCAGDSPNAARWCLVLTPIYISIEDGRLFALERDPEEHLWFEPCYLLD
jgi:hypothetical protein